MGAQSPQGRTLIDFQKRRQLFIRVHNEPFSACFF
jgi:hypothetical protein